MADEAKKAEALRCLNCGIRRLVVLDVLGDDGNPLDDCPDIRQCPGCQRVYEVVPDGENTVKLILKVANSTMMSLRAL